MSLAIILGGSNVIDYTKPDSLIINDDINDINTASFELVFIDTPSYITPGTPVTITMGSEIIFAGNVDNVESRRYDSKLIITQRVTCVDYNHLCTRHVYAGSFVNKTLKQIVEAVVSETLAKEGITTDYVQEGPVIEKCNFNYETVFDIFNELAELTSYKWYIDYNKKLHFFDRLTNYAPYEISESSPIFHNLRLRVSRDEYRNVQYVRGGRAETTPRTEAFVGDGKKKTFTLAYPISEILEVRVNGLIKPSGIQGTPGVDWYYVRGEKIITQADELSPLTATDVLTVYYVGFYPIITVYEHTNEIQKQKQIEGGTGRYANMEYDETIESMEEAIKKAEGLLKTYGSMPRVVEFDTTYSGFKSGQIVKINLPSFKLADQFLVYNVETSDIEGKLINYHVKCVGSEASSWVAFFRGLAESKKRYVIRENEKILKYFMVSSYGGTTSNVKEILTVNRTIPCAYINYAMLDISEVTNSPIYSIVLGGMVMI